jgi:hypothetical protein
MLAPLLLRTSFRTTVAESTVMLSSFVLSAALIEPAADVVAALMLIAGVVVPFETAIGVLPVTEVTVPVPPVPLEARVIRPFASTLIEALV